MAKILSLKLGTATNPDTGEVVTRAYAVVEGMERPVKILDSVADLKAAGKPADVLKTLLVGVHPEWGTYAYLPKIKFENLTW